MSERVLCRDKPGAWWFLVFLFVTVSLCFLYLGVTEHSTIPLWQSTLVILFAFAGIGAGIWLATQSPLSTTLLDEADGHLIIRRFGIGHPKVTRIPVASIRKVVIEERKDDEGYDMSRPALLLTDGGTVLLSLLWRHGEVDTLHVARSVVAAVPRLSGGDPRLIG